CPKRTVFIAVAPARDPADQVVAVGRSERQDRNELQLRVAWKTHQDVIGFDSVCTSLSLLAAALLRDSPDVFSVVEDLLVLDVINRIDAGLRAKQEFWIADVRA